MYTQLLPRSKKKKVRLDPIEVGEVRGNKMMSSETYINNALGCTVRICHKLANKLEKKLDELRGWLAPLLSETTTP